MGAIFHAARVTAGRVDKLPDFYRQPRPLAGERHTGLTVASSPHGFRFAAATVMVVLTHVEFFAAARFFPIVFAEDAAGRLLPHALLGLRKGENLFLDARGGWLAPYLPACLRCYPFALAPGGEGGMTVWYDGAFDGFHRENGAALFVDGEPGPLLLGIQDFLQDYQRQLQETESFCRELRHAGILAGSGAVTATPDDGRLSWDTLFVVDERQLDQLPDMDIVHLFRRGTLALIQAHLLSLRNLERLASLAGKSLAGLAFSRPAAASTEASAAAGKKEKTACRQEGGFHPPFRQPVQQLRMVIDVPAAFNMEALDAWLKVALELDYEPCLADVPGEGRTAAASTVIALARRCLLVARSLLQAAGIPAFDPGAVLDIRPDGGGLSRWDVTVALPHIAEIPAAAFNLSVAGAMKIIGHGAANSVREDGRGDDDRMFAGIEERVLRPLRRMVVAGKSTIPLLGNAYRMGMPFFHLGGGAYQLGWGSKARRLDRSGTGGDALIGAKLAQHKFWSAGLLRMAGLPAPEQEIAATEEAARHLARRLGWPVVVKPADLDRGEGVATGIKDEAALLAAYRSAREKSRIKQVLLEREAPGACHRLLVANGRVLYSVRRLPKSVTGDGLQTVAGLIRSANRGGYGKAPWLRSEPFPEDDLTVATLAASGLTLDSVPAAGMQVPLRPFESIQWGGEEEDVGARLHPENQALALRVAALFDLYVAGIDVISPDIAIPWYANGAVVNEVNFAPMLGDGPVSEAYIPAFLSDFMDGDGRIPIEVIAGGNQALAAAKARQQERVRAGGRCFVTTADLTLDAAGGEIPLTFKSLFQRCRALLMDRQVEELILVLQTDEWLYTGSPVDRFTPRFLAAPELTSWQDPGRQLTADRVARLRKFLEHFAT